MRNAVIVLITLYSYAHCRPQTRDNSETSTETIQKISILPYYGGGKGQALQIVETSDGKVTTTIIKTPENLPDYGEETIIDAQELENPQLPSKFDKENFGENIRNIEGSALKIIKLQEIAKENGNLTKEEENKYQTNMAVLTSSAQNLAKLQEMYSPLDFETREGLSAWFERKQIKSKGENKTNPDEGPNKSEKEEKNKNKKEEETRKKQEEQKNKEEEESRKEEEENEGPENEDNNGVAINLPPEDASVAEAKPVGLAVAGIGGVASSKPIATAVVGPGGLAIARPVGTAIAGVSPDQALIPIYAEGAIGTSKPPKGSSSSKKDPMTEFLSKIINKYHQT